MDEFIAAVKPLLDEKQEQIDEIKKDIGGDFTNGSKKIGLAGQLRDTEKIAVEALCSVRELHVKTEKICERFDELSVKFDCLMNKHDLNIKIQRVGSSVGIGMVLGLIMAPVGVALNVAGCVPIATLFTVGVPAWLTATGGLIAILYKIK